MRPFLIRIVALGVMPLVLLAACNRKSSARPLPIEQVPQVLNDAFKQAQPEASSAAREIVVSVQSGDQSAALLANELAGRSDLTDEQRAAAYRVAAALRQKMAEDAARGDKKAQDALETYRASK